MKWLFSIFCSILFFFSGELSAQEANYWVYMEQIDDIGRIYVNGGLVAECSWIGVNGRMDGPLNITPYLTEGSNTVRFYLFNKEWNEWLPEGKYSYAFYLFQTKGPYVGNRKKTIFEERDSRSDKTAGVRYDRTITIYYSKRSVRVESESGTRSGRAESSHAVQLKNIILPKLWTRKRQVKNEISKNFQISMALQYLRPSKTSLLIGLRASNDSYWVEGDRGAIYCVLPCQLSGDDTDIRIDYLDVQDERVPGVTLQGFNDVILEILKYISPGLKVKGYDINVAGITEKVFQIVGVGSLEDFSLDNTAFVSRRGYEPYAKYWDPIYSDGRWIRGNCVQIQIPLDMDLSEAKRVISENGVGVLFFVNLNCTGAKVGIMRDGMRF
jgi:hypothetical protein